MAIALDRRVAYFAVEQLSSHVDISPEGYLICRDVVIGRTGFQTYKVSEIADPDGLLADANLHPDDDVQLWRDPSEVFSPTTIASFEGKTVTLTHPEGLLTPDTEQDHFVGNLQNVRAGTQPLENGTFPLLADLIIKAREAIDAFNHGMREVSCGYLYELAREGYRWDQRKIIGNHVALVPRGRAGAEARINDAAPKETTSMSFRDLIRSHGWKTFAKDASPEDVAKALDEETAARTAVATVENKVEKIAEVKFVCVGKDAKGVKLYKSVAVDAEEEEKEEKKEAKDDGMEEENKAAMDFKKRMHDTLDKMMANKDAEKKEQSEQEDADLKALRDMFTGTGDAKDAEEGADDAHPDGCRCADCMDKGKDAEKEEEKEEADDAGDIVRPEPVLKEGEVPKSAFDAAMTMDLLKQFRKIVAKSTDKKMAPAFDVLYQGMKAAAKGTGNSKATYANFRTAASKASDEKISTAKDSADKDWKPRVSPLEAIAVENDAIYKKAAEEARKKSRVQVQGRSI